MAATAMKARTAVRGRGAVSAKAKASRGARTWRQASTVPVALANPAAPQRPGVGRGRFASAARAKALATEEKNPGVVLDDSGKGKRVLVVGGDGYCGWASALHLSARG